jgi:hypothetical protein
MIIIGRKTTEADLFRIDFGTRSSLLDFDFQVQSPRAVGISPHTVAAERWFRSRLH